jgi:hypothetical protein
LRKLRRALHVQDDAVLRNLLADGVVRAHGMLLEFKPTCILPQLPAGASEPEDAAIARGFNNGGGQHHSLTAPVSPET